MDTLKGEFILHNDKTDLKSSLPDALTTLNGVQSIKKGPHFYSSFFQDPEGLSFEDIEQGESILLLLRRHFVTNVPWIAATIVLLILPFLFPFILTFFPFPLPESHTIMLFMGFYYLFVFGFVLLNFTLWYFQAGLVTNRRIIDVDLSGILYRQVSEAKIQNIQDVTYNQIGFIRSLFNYGNVLVQTAGAEENIEYDRVPRPARVADIIGDLSQEA